MKAKEKTTIKTATKTLTIKTNHYRKFKLEPYTGLESRHECPKCGDKHSFTYYIHDEASEQFFENVGRCSHERSCGYHKTPMLEYGFSYKDGGGLILGLEPYIQDALPVKEISFFNEEQLIETESNFHENNFVQFLLSLYDYDIVMKVIDNYRIGTSDQWKGSTIFWNLDKQNKIRSGNVVQHNKTTGEEVQTKGCVPIKTMYSILMKKGLIDENFNQKPCLYGEHLLINSDRPVCIVETKKTAIIASINFPEYTWLAIGGSIHDLTNENIQALNGRDVTLYPHNDIFELWSEKASEFKFKISSIVKEKCKAQNADLADYILEYSKGTTYSEDDLPF